jgi:hypothetical protein
MTRSSGRGLLLRLGGLAEMRRKDTTRGRLGRRGFECVEVVRLRLAPGALLVVHPLPRRAHPAETLAEFSCVVVLDGRGV